MNIYDLTFEIETGMPTCGTDWHQNVQIVPMGTIDEVGRNTQRIVLGSHSGTHMDAPYHFIQDGTTMESLDINYMWGTAKVVDFRNKGQGDVVTIDDVRNIDVEERLIFVFGWYHNWKTDKYYKDFPCFSTEAIEYLISKGMKFMAMDTPSPDDGSAINMKEGEDSPNHKILLREKIVMVEYLNNTDVLDSSKRYEIVALPMKVKGSDGSPARVLVREV